MFDGTRVPAFASHDISSTYYRENGKFGTLRCRNFPHPRQSFALNLLVMNGACSKPGHNTCTYHTTLGITNVEDSNESQLNLLQHYGFNSAFSP